MSTKSKWRRSDIEHYTSVEKIQEQLKKENTNYICGHPEIRAIMRTLLHEAINRDPAEPSELAAAIFDFNTNGVLKFKIDEERLFIQRELKKGNWDKHDLDNLTRSTSTHSLLSEASLSTDLDAILRFCLIMPKKVE